MHHGHVILLILLYAIFNYVFFSLEEQVDTSNKILYGSLMCISLNKKFDSLIWATVVDSRSQSDPNMK